MRKRFQAIAHWKAEPIKACVCAVSTPSDRKVCRDPGQPLVGPCSASVESGEIVCPPSERATAQKAVGRVFKSHRGR